jgi:hypothetical protein
MGHPRSGFVLGIGKVFRERAGLGESPFISGAWREQQIPRFARNDKWFTTMKKKDKWIKGCKERGEWAELCFMARAKGLGMGVMKPYGDSRCYDVAVESGGRILRVQVKSTIYCRRGGEYSLSVTGARRKRYPKGSVDFFAVWVIPIGEWYIIPYEAMGQRLTLHFTPGSKRSKWIKYREAWELLRVLEIQACVDPLMLEEGGEELLSSLRRENLGTDGKFPVVGLWRERPVCARYPPGPSRSSGELPSGP